jgi:hypothetical protein
MLMCQIHLPITQFTNCGLTGLVVIATSTTIFFSDHFLLQNIWTKRRNLIHFAFNEINKYMV